MRVDAIVLAAGSSSRMGRPKMLLPYGGSTIIGSVVDALLLSPIYSVTVVLGYHAAAVREAVGDRPVRMVVNPEPERGMLSSIQVGIESVKDADAFLIALGDQPQMRPETVEALVAAAAASSKSILIPVYLGKRGHPLLLRASHRQDILSLPHSVGLNSLIAARRDGVLEVEVGARDVLEDIDTPEDYARLLSHVDQ